MHSFRPHWIPTENENWAKDLCLYIFQILFPYVYFFAFSFLFFRFLFFLFLFYVAVTMRQPVQWEFILYISTVSLHFPAIFYLIFPPFFIFFLSLNTNYLRNNKGVRGSSCIFFSENLETIAENSIHIINIKIKQWKKERKKLKRILCIWCRFFFLLFFFFFSFHFLVAREREERDRYIDR